MAIDVSAFTAAARAEFMQGKMDAENRSLPANYDPFTTKISSTVRVENHTYMSALPRLEEFRGYSSDTRIVNQSYDVTNKTYRIGPVTVRKEDLDDDQVGGYLASVKGLPAQGQKDIGYKLTTHLANGTSTTCFDGSNFFASSHTVGSGDNLITANNSGNDGATHKIVALVLTNNVMKPLLFQDRESLSTLQTDEGTAQAEEKREYKYWADCRFGLGYGFWWDAVHLTITDTPSLTELQGHIKDIINQFRTFTLPKGRDVDDTMYVHENWMPDSSNFVLLCNMALGELLDTIRTESLIAAGSSGATITNQYRNKFQLVTTSSLGA